MSKEKYIYIKHYTLEKLLNTIGPGINCTNTGTPYVAKIKSTTTLGTREDKPLTHGNAGSFWVGENSNRVKLGKVIKYIYNIDDDAKVEEYCNIWKQEYEPLTYPIRIKSDVESVYSWEYKPNGTLGGSCMQGYGSFYSNIPAKVLVMVDDNDILIGRALLWDNTYDADSGNQFKFMDRIYYSSNGVFLSFIEWAKTNKYWYKQKQSNCDCKTFVCPVTDNVVTKNIRIEAPNVLEGDAPYMDTLFYYDGKYLNNYNGEYQLRNTDGTIDGANTGYCSCCGDYIHEDELRYVESVETQVCQDCIGTYYIWSDTLEEYVYMDSTITVTRNRYGDVDIVHSDTDLEYYDLYVCEITDELYHENYLIYTQDCYFVSDRETDSLYYYAEEDIYFYDEDEYLEYIKGTEEDE